MGITRAILKLEGKTPLQKQELIRETSGRTRQGEIIFKKLLDNLSKPAEFETLRRLIVFSTSSSVVGERNMVLLCHGG